MSRQSRFDAGYWMLGATLSSFHAPLPTGQQLSGGIPATLRLEGLLTVCLPPVSLNSCLSSLLKV